MVINGAAATATTALRHQVDHHQCDHYQHYQMRNHHHDHDHHQQEQHLAVSVTDQHHRPNSNDIYTVVSHIHYTMDPFQSTQYNR
jgi:hypothetical protein